MKVYWLDVVLIAVLFVLLVKLEAAFRRWWYRRHPALRDAPVRFEQPAQELWRIDGAARPVECDTCQKSTPDYVHFSNGARTCPDCAARLRRVVRE